MDSQRNSTEREQGEVVLLVSGEDISTTKDSKVESLEEPNKYKLKCASPELSLKSSTSPKKPPKPPHSESFLRCRSIHTSAFMKPKSRFVEQTLPKLPNLDSSSSPYYGSPNQRPSGILKSAKLEDEDEEEEEEEIIKKGQLHENPRKRRRFKVWTLVEWLILVLSISCLVTSLLVHRLRGQVIWGLDIWKWCLMVAVICCGRLVTNWFINVLVFMIERTFLLKKKVLYFVYALKNSVQVFLWLDLILLTWSLIFNRGVERSHKTEVVLGYVSRLLISLMIGSAIWLIKTLLMKILASSFRMNRFFDRIQESIFHQYILQTLSGPLEMELAEKVGSVKSSWQLSFRTMGKGKGKRGEDKEVIDVAKLHKMRQEKVSAWTMKGLIKVIRTSGLSTLSDTIDEAFEDGGAQRDTEITSEWEAKVAAFRIFKNVAKPCCKYIDAEDLLRFFSKEEVEYVLLIFEGAPETGKIKKSALRNWVVKAYLDRKALAHSLNDTKTAVNQLHKLATIIVIVAILIITLIVLGIATTQVLVFISSQFLLVGFMFGNTCKMVFEAIIFVFVMHPFDVGDRCVVDGVQMVVEEMNILNTVFLKFDNEKIYYPNSVLAMKPISNFYRSPNMSDAVEFSVQISTSVESIGALKARIKMYLESKPNHWQPNHNMVVKGIVNVNKMDIALYVNHTMNFQNIGEKNTRRSELVLELKKIFEELSIQCHLLPQKVQFSYTGSVPLPVAINQSI